jgi:prophage regulatory protein
MNIPAEQHSPFPFRDRILRQAEVEAKVGFRKTKMWELIADRAFPEPIALGPRAVGWRESEVDRWIAELPRATRFAKYLQGQLRPFFTRGPQIWNSFRKRVEQNRHYRRPQEQDHAPPGAGFLFPILRCGTRLNSEMAPVSP